MKTLIKENFAYLLIGTFSGILCVLSASFFLPLLRNGNETGGIILIIIYGLCFISSLIFMFLFFRKLKSNAMILKKQKNLLAVILFFSSIIILSLILTITFLIIRATNPQSIFLTQGILSEALILGYYLISLFPILVNQNFLN